MVKRLILGTPEPNLTELINQISDKEELKVTNLERAGSLLGPMMLASMGAMVGEMEPRPGQGRKRVGVDKSKRMQTRRRNSKNRIAKLSRRRNRR
jgi:hypothetical protein